MKNQITKPKTIPQNIWEVNQLIASIIERKRQRMKDANPPQSQIAMEG